MKSVWVEGTLQKDEVHNILLLRSDEPPPKNLTNRSKYMININTTCGIGWGEGRRKQDKISPPRLATAVRILDQEM